MSTDLFDTYARSFEARRETVMTLGEYLKGCKTDPLMYASPHERLLAAIGEPQMVDTSQGYSPRPHLHEPHDPDVSGLR